MYDKDFAELVKIAAEKLKEDTVYKMLTRSEDYQKESDARDKAERNYENLDLTMEQRKVCDIFLDYRDRQSLILPVTIREKKNNKLPEGGFFRLAGNIYFQYHQEVNDEIQKNIPKGCGCCDGCGYGILRTACHHSLCSRRRCWYDFLFTHL